MPRSRPSNAGPARRSLPNRLPPRPPAIPGAASTCQQRRLLEAMAKPTITNRLEAARAELAATNRQIAEIEAERNAALLRDDDSTAGKLAKQMEDMPRLERGHEDTIR